jgi:hypothetical protein
MICLSVIGPKLAAQLRAIDAGIAFMTTNGFGARELTKQSLKFSPDATEAQKAQCYAIVDAFDFDV